jgi:hypothetical protein
MHEALPKTSFHASASMLPAQSVRWHVRCVPARQRKLHVLGCVWKTCLASKCIAPRRMRHFFAIPGVYGQCCALSCAFGSPALLIGTGLVAGCCDS